MTMGDYGLTNVVASSDTRWTLQSLYRPNKSCLNDADEDGASTDESPADTESNYGNNNSHDSDDEILLDNV